MPVLDLAFISVPGYAFARNFTLLLQVMLGVSAVACTVSRTPSNGGAGRDG